MYDVWVMKQYMHCTIDMVNITKVSNQFLLNRKRIRCKTFKSSTLIRFAHSFLSLLQERILTNLVLYYKQWNDRIFNTSNWSDQDESGNEFNWLNDNWIDREPHQTVFSRSPPVALFLSASRVKTWPAFKRYIVCKIKWNLCTPRMKLKEKHFFPCDYLHYIRLFFWF